MSRPIMTRKDVAQATGLSVKQVVRNERRLGLEPYRLNKRVVVYAAAQVQAALQRMGITPRQ